MLGIEGASSGYEGWINVTAGQNLTHSEAPNLRLLREGRHGVPPGGTSEWTHRRTEQTVITDINVEHIRGAGCLR